MQFNKIPKIPKIPHFAPITPNAKLTGGAPGFGGSAVGKELQHYPIKTPLSFIRNWADFKAMHFHNPLGPTK